MCIRDSLVITTKSQGRLLRAEGACIAASSIAWICSLVTGVSGSNFRTLRRLMIASAVFIYSSSFNSLLLFCFQLITISL